MDPANTAVTDTPEQQIILNISTQKASQHPMLKLQQCSDDNVLTGELPCPGTSVPGQTEEPGRRGADLKGYPLTISDRCLILCFIPMLVWVYPPPSLYFGDDYVDFRKYKYWEEERKLSTKAAFTRLQWAWPCLLLPAVSNFFWYQWIITLFAFRNNRIKHITEKTPKISTEHLTTLH